MVFSFQVSPLATLSRLRSGFQVIKSRCPPRAAVLQPLAVLGADFSNLASYTIEDGTTDLQPLAVPGAVFRRSSP
ncbi:hypothetical protein NDA03_25865 [Trichocoleus sp. Lan]